MGLAVQATPNTLARLRRGQQARLDTALVVREDSLTLFGFADASEREMFLLLQTVSGVGPRVALATLAVLDPASLSHALADGNLTTLMSVPGIGRKGAERLVVELRDKVAPPSAARRRRRDARLGRGRGDAARPGGRGAGRPRLRRQARREGRRRGARRLRPARRLLRCPARRAEPARAAMSEHDREASLERALASTPADGESDLENKLRPARLAEFIGQPRVREQLDLVLRGALGRGSPPDHVLLSGPPGLGKTSLAMIIGAELGSPVRITSGPALERAGDLAAMLSNLVEGDVLFIDEIHRMARPAEEMLYLAMEDFRVDVVVGKGPGATSIPLDVAPFTLVGATTRAGALTGPLRDRFGFTAHMEFYEPEDLELVRPAQRAASSRSTCAPTAAARSPTAPGARPASPTACCAGCATTPRSAPTAR